MKKSGQNLRHAWLDRELCFWQQNRLIASNALSMVNSHELDSLRQSLSGGLVPLDLQAKLAQLSGDDLTRHILGQHCRTFIALLLTAQSGAFRPVSATAREQLLRVLAYVRKDDDAIPDYQPKGYGDDLAEASRASAQLAPLLQEFKHWWLRHQVPGMWLKRFPLPQGENSPNEFAL